MLTVTVLASAGPAAAQQVEVTADGLIAVDGRRMFVLGLYEVLTSESDLGQIAGAGFNAVAAEARIDSLDRLARHGLHGWVSAQEFVNAALWRRTNASAPLPQAAALAEHPALLLWEMPDEELWGCWWRPLDYRQNAEPARQWGRIAALPDGAERARLETQRRTADELFARGEFDRSQELADGIWRQLGEPVADPSLSLAAAPACAERFARGFDEGYALLKQVEPCHPVFTIHAPRNQTADLARYNSSVDILGCDIYPVPEFVSGHSDLPDQTLASVGAYTDLMRQAGAGRPVFMALQAFAWADLEDNPPPVSYARRPRPTFEQSRFMAYDAIVHGVRGLLWWGTQYLDRGSALWGDLLLLVRELSDLQPVLTAPDASCRIGVEIGPTWISQGHTVVVVAKQAEDGLWLLVVNENKAPLRYTLRGLPLPDGARLSDDAERVEGIVAGGAVSLAIRGNGVHVLRSGKPPSPQSNRQP
jgi:hypothetical protein